MMERSQRLHNFEMPCLRWRNQRFLRCMKVNPNGYADYKSSSYGASRGGIGRRKESEFGGRGSSDRRRESFKDFPSSAIDGRSFAADKDGGIEAVREKLLSDLQAAANKMKDAMLRENFEETRLPQPPASVPAQAPEKSSSPVETDTLKPWNLRTRRAKAPTNVVNGHGGGAGCEGKSLNVDVRNPNISPLRNENRSPRLRGPVAAGEKREREKFSVSLSRREMEDDFMAMSGRRLPRRPKKRPKNVQKQLDALFPGLWLSEVNADNYKVPDDPENAKWL